MLWHSVPKNLRLWLCLPNSPVIRRKIPVFDHLHPNSLNLCPHKQAVMNPYMSICTTYSQKDQGKT